MQQNTTEDYFERLDRPLKEIAERLRHLIYIVSPEIEEQLKWNVPTYSINKNICSIMVHKNHVNIQIMQGALLENAALLDGTGKAMRHLKFSTVDEIDTTLVKNILEQAITLDT